MKNRIILAVLALFTFSCSEPIDFEFGEVDPQLVINGFITDSLRTQSVTLSYTTKFAAFSPELEADVVIKDDQGTSFFLEHVGSGRYEIAEFAASQGRSYKLIVEARGELYETDYESLPSQNSTLNLSLSPDVRAGLSGNSAVIDHEGVAIIADIIPEEDPTFNLYFIEHWFQAIAFGAPVDRRVCYAKDFDIPRVVLSADRSIINGGNGDSYPFEIDFIPLSRRTTEEFVMSVTRFGISQEAHEFWSQIEDQIENTGSLFDGAPNNIRGNAYNSITAKPILGYFGVYNETLSRFYFNDKDLPFRLRNYSCQPIPPVPGIPSPPDPCLDCLAISADIIQREKPVWWR